MAVLILSCILCLLIGFTIGVVACVAEEDTREKKRDNNRKEIGFIYTN